MRLKTLSEALPHIRTQREAEVQTWGYRPDRHAQGFAQIIIAPHLKPGQQQRTYQETNDGIGGRYLPLRYKGKSFLTYKTVVSRAQTLPVLLVEYAYFCGTTTTTTTPQEQRYGSRSGAQIMQSFLEEFELKYDYDRDWTRQHLLVVIESEPEEPPVRFANPGGDRRREVLEPLLAALEEKNYDEMIRLVDQVEWMKPLPTVVASGTASSSSAAGNGAWLSNVHARKEASSLYPWHYQQQQQQPVLPAWSLSNNNEALWRPHNPPPNSNVASVPPRPRPGLLVGFPAPPVFSNAAASAASSGIALPVPQCASHFVDLTQEQQQQQQSQQQQPQVSASDVANQVVRELVPVLTQLTRDNRIVIMEKLDRPSTPPWDPNGSESLFVPDSPLWSPGMPYQVCRMFSRNVYQHVPEQKIFYKMSGCDLKLIRFDGKGGSYFEVEFIADDGTGNIIFSGKVVLQNGHVATKWNGQEGVLVSPRDKVAMEMSKQKEMRSHLRQCILLVVQSKDGKKGNIHCFPRIVGTDLNPLLHANLKGALGDPQTSIRRSLSSDPSHALTNEGYQRQPF